MELYGTASEESGHVDAMNHLASDLVNGAEGVLKDASRAVGLYERGTGEGRHVNATKNFSLLFQNGTGGA